MHKVVSKNYLKIDINYLNDLLAKSDFNVLIEYCENIKDNIKSKEDYDKNVTYLYYYLGIAYSHKKEVNLAVDAYKKVIELSPDYTDAYYNLAMCLYNNEKYSDAIPYFLKLNQLNPDEKYETLSNIGTCYRNIGEFNKAFYIYDELLYIIDNNVNNTVFKFNKDEIYTIMGCIVSDDLKNFEKLYESLYYFKKAYEINQDTRCVNNLLSNYGLLCMNNEYIDLSEKVFKNFSVCKTKYDKLEEQKYNILSCYDLIDDDRYQTTKKYVLSLFNDDKKYKDEYDKQQFNGSLHYLRVGDYGKGFEYYMKRYTNTQWKKNCIPQEIFEKIDHNKLWNNENVDNKSILIVCEQGIGDIFQFLRFIKMFPISTKIYVFVQMNNLARVLRIINELQRVTFIDNIDKSIYYDYFTFLMTLPYHFKTRIDNIPPPLGNINIRPNIITKWKDYFNDFKKVKIGINLFGRGGPNKDSRAVPFESVKPLFKNIDAIFFNLNLEKINTEGFDNIIQFENIDKQIPFEDTIEIMKNMDYVITSDTSIVHLAGSYAKKPMMLLKYYSEWRWLRFLTSSVWYPKLKIYRQEIKDKYWDDAIERLIDDINFDISIN